MKEKKMMGYASIFMEHCLASMEKTGQLSDDCPHEIAEMKEDRLARIPLTELAEWLMDKYDDIENIASKDMLKLAQERAEENKTPWISCTNQWMSVEKRILKNKTPEEAFEKIDEIIDHATKIIEEMTPNLIIPNKIEVLRFQFHDGKTKRADLIARVKRSIDKTEMDPPKAMPDFIESLNQNDFIEK